MIALRRQSHIAPAILSLCLAAVTIPASAREVALSEKPIPVRLPVGKEFIITFPQAITHTNVLNEEAARHLDTMLTPNGVLYATAAEPFDTARMVAELVDGRLVMLDVSAGTNGPWDSDLTVTEAAAKAETQAQSTQGVAQAQAPKENPYKPDFLKDGADKTLSAASAGIASTAYHDMVRFGFRHYVGPSRLIGPDLGKPVKMATGEIGNELIRLNAGKLSVKPLKQWEIDGYYLTVLLINNKSYQTVDFDPRAIRGRYVYAAALHPVLGPAGSARDQTLWALISKVPFNKSGR